MIRHIIRSGAAVLAMVLAGPGTLQAQTMLSLRQWQEGGWFNNYFLFKP